MKSDAGREIVQHLVSGADVLIHNFRPGVPERLGIGYAEVAARNPGIVYLQCNGYGPDGPGAQRPSTHPIPGAAMGGVMFQLGHRVPSDLQDMDGLRQWTRRLMRANEVNPDPNTALVVATSALLGLTARRETGTGQRILVDMFGANAYANHDDFLSYPGKSDRVLPDEGLYGLSATYRLYECKQQQWIFLALTTPRERAQFTAALAETAIESPDLGRLSDDALQSALAALFKTRDADEWQSTLTRYGVACVRADGPIPSEFWLQDPQAAALALTRPAHHPSLGQYQRHGAMVHFDHSRSELKGPPSAGQHNQDVIQALGYTTEQIAHLYAAGVLWQDEQ
jgi:crotonobetainyl-CoA:carnitine CoA-transferase CaiB-like acyl-CoA transferase